MRKASAILISAILAFCSLPASASDDASGEQKDFSTHVYLKSKLSFTTNGPDAFVKANFLRLSVEGTFAKDFSYVIRQRLNKAPQNGDFLDATDYLYLNWKKNNWEIGAGKHYIACGDYEYQESSYDTYMLPIFYYNLVGMYTYLADVAYNVGNEKLIFQLSNSLYAPSITDLAGISLAVNGREGIWEHYWSVNGFEREKHKWNGFQCFGNILHFNRLDLYLDLTHRFDMASPTFFKDFSSCIKFRYKPAEWVNILGKVSWDYKENGIEDPILPDGTNHWLVGGGCEFFPIKTYRNLRLHCFGWGDSGVFNSVTGFSWQLDIIGKK